MTLVLAVLTGLFFAATCLLLAGAVLDKRLIRQLLLTQQNLLDRIQAPTAAAATAPARLSPVDAITPPAGRWVHSRGNVARVFVPLDQEEA